MSEFDLRKLQLVELEMLKDVANFCDEHDIEYFLDSGTLLGAVRHKGFIPWDDDIDICMDVKNYKKFTTIAPKLLSDKYFVQNYKTDPKVCIRWSKIRINGTTSMEADMTNYDIHYGICMDIFEICGVAETRIGKWIQNIACNWKSILLEKYLVEARQIKVSRKIKILYRIIPEKVRLYTISLLDWFTQINPRNHAKCYSTFRVSPYNMDTHIYPSSLYKQRKCYQFEGCKFWSVKDAESYLKMCYGNWWELPPEDQRGGHGDIIVDFDNNYTKYQTSNR